MLTVFRHNLQLPRVRVCVCVCVCVPVPLFASVSVSVTVRSLSLSLSVVQAILYTHASFCDWLSTLPSHLPNTHRRNDSTYKTDTVLMARAPRCRSSYFFLIYKKRSAPDHDEVVNMYKKNCNMLPGPSVLLSRLWKGCINIVSRADGISVHSSVLSACGLDMTASIGRAFHIFYGMWVRDNVWVHR